MPGKKVLKLQEFSAMNLQQNSLYKKSQPEADWPFLSFTLKSKKHIRFSQ